MRIRVSFLVMTGFVACRRLLQDVERDAGTRSQGGSAGSNPVGATSDTSFWLGQKPWVPSIWLRFDGCVGALRLATPGSGPTQVQSPPSRGGDRSGASADDSRPPGGREVVVFDPPEARLGEIRFRLRSAGRG